MQQSTNRHSVFKLTVLCLGILILGSFSFTIREMSESAGIAVITQAPRESEPVATTFKPSNPSLMREQLGVSVRTESETGSDVKIQSSLPYPPQLGISFLSFASFSSSVMSSMSTMAYYQSNFTGDIGFDVGTFIVIVLIALLIFLELTGPVTQGKTTAVLGRLRIRFSTVTWILFIIFMGIVYTKVVFVLAT